MGDEKEGKTLAFLVARERETIAVLSTVVLRKTTGDRICRRLMAWLREIGLESVDIIVESNNEPGLKSLIASWSTMRAMTSGSRTSAENSPAGSPKSDGIDERAIQSAQGMIRTIRSDIEGLWGGEDRCDACHLAVDCRARGIFVDEVRGWSRWKNPRTRVERQVGKEYKPCRSPKESCGRGNEQEDRSGS